MKTEYKYIHFELKEVKPKTEVYSCKNSRSGEELAFIAWYGPWRQYCFFPTIAAVYSIGCLNDIEDFITQLKAKRKNDQS